MSRDGRRKGADRLRGTRLLTAIGPLLKWSTHIGQGWLQVRARSAMTRPLGHLMHQGNVVLEGPVRDEAPSCRSGPPRSNRQTRQGMNQWCSVHGLQLLSALRRCSDALGHLAEDGSVERKQDPPIETAKQAPGHEARILGENGPVVG